MNLNEVLRFETNSLTWIHLDFEPGTKHCEVGLRIGCQVGLVKLYWYHGLVWCGVAW